METARKVYNSNLASGTTASSVTRASDVVVDLLEQTIWWSPYSGHSQKCVIGFRVKSGADVDLAKESQLLLAVPDLRVVSDCNPLASTFAKRVLSFSNLISLEGCMVRGLRIASSEAVDLSLVNVTLVESSLKVHGTLECKNINVINSVLDVNLQRGNFEAMCIDHASRLRGTLGASRLSADCEIHGLAYDLDLRAVSFDRPETLPDRLCDAIFSRKKLKIPGINKADLVDLGRATASKVIPVRVQATAQLAFDEITPPHSDAPSRTPAEPKDLVFISRSATAPSQSMRSTPSIISEPELHGSWFTAPLRKFTWGVGQKKAAVIPDARYIVNVICEGVPEEPETVRMLSANPRMPGTFALSDLSWPLEVLGLTEVPSFEQLTILIESLHKEIEQLGYDPESAAYARSVVDKTYRFLRWGQNRARLEIGIGTDIESDRAAQI